MLFQDGWAEGSPPNAALAPFVGRTWAFMLLQDGWARRAGPLWKENIGVRAAPERVGREFAVECGAGHLVGKHAGSWYSKTLGQRVRRQMQFWPQFGLESMRAHAVPRWMGRRLAVKRGGDSFWRENMRVHAVPK